MARPDDELPEFSPIPRVQIIDIAAKPGKPIFWRAFSDLHLDEDLCDREYLTKQARHDKQIYGNVRAMVIGDVANLVFSVDQRRFTPAVLRRELATRSAFIDAAVESNASFLGTLGYEWDMIGLGNHETSALRHYGSDVAGRIAGKLGARRGGFSGVVDFRVHVNKDGVLPRETSGRNVGHKLRFRVVYAHGNWGGHIAKGYGRARAYADQHDGWNAMLYGHNHKVCVHKEVRIKVDGENLTEYPVYVIDCGSATRAYGDDARDPQYAEVKGYMREPRAAPLLSLTVRWGNGGMMEPDYTVTI